MSVLNKLQQATSLHCVAHILGFKPAALSYILYIKDKDTKYHQFSIPKRSGGLRLIKAPEADLKILQKRLSVLLQDCIDEINHDREINNALSHGFRRHHSIITNAKRHRNRRYVFNIDLEDFFGSINFGRVRGFFIKNNGFKLNKNVSTILSQIICHDNALPQGSPCSPVVSNLIGHILDIRLVSLAYSTGCTYSRYADDITFSCNTKDFPKKIANILVGDNHQWEHGAALEKIVVKSGFAINATKTRMQYKDSRQSVTGLVVNKKVNVRSEYWRTARAMADTLFRTGCFYIRTITKNSDGEIVAEAKEGSVKQLNGILGFIDQLDLYNKRKDPGSVLRNLSSRENVYRKFLFYNNFFSPSHPKIICEGKTDNIYIKEAIKNLSADYPKLIDHGNKTLKVGFFKYTDTTDRLCSLAGGTSDLRKFIFAYLKECKHFKVAKNNNPVIILIDNDDDNKRTYSVIKKVTYAEENVDGSESFYHLGENLYVVAIPKLNNNETIIEDYFDQDILNTIHNNRSFSRKSTYNSTTEYGKHVFATEVIKNQSNTISFDKFAGILDRLVLVVGDYEAKLSGGLVSRL